MRKPSFKAALVTLCLASGGILAPVGITAANAADIPVADLGTVTIVDQDGWVNDSVTAPANTDEIEYELTYSQAAGTWSLKATATSGNQIETEDGGLVGEYTITGEDLNVDLRKVVAAAPTIVDNSGTADDSVTAPENTSDVTYVLVYVQATGEWKLTANTSRADTVFIQNDTNKFIAEGALNINTIVTPSNPTITDKPGYLEDAVVAPDDGDGITYTAFAYNQTTGVWSMTATADDGYEFDDGSKTKNMTGNLNVSKVAVTANNPVIVDHPGTANDSVTKPADTAEVKYTLTYDKNTGVWSMTATLADTVPADRVIAQSGARTWTTSGNLSTAATVLDAAPTVTDKPGWVEDTVVAPKDSLTVVYDLDYNQTTGKWTQTATALGNNVFPNGTKTNVRTGQLDVNLIKVDAQLPVIVDKPGTVNDTVTKPANTASVNYNLLFDQATGYWELQATTTRPDTVFTQNNQRQYLINGTLERNGIVTADDAVIIDQEGWVNDEVRVPADTDFIKYTLDYDQKLGMWTLTAKTKAGYSFADGTDTKVTSGKLNVAQRKVNADKPHIEDNLFTARDAVVAPANTADIKYTLDYDRSLGRWTLTANTTREDTVFAANNDVTLVQMGNLEANKPVVAQMPTINDVKGWSSDGVTPPTTDGISYNLSYDKQTGAWTLEATALDGFLFEDGSESKTLNGVLNVEGESTLPEGYGVTGDTENGSVYGTGGDNYGSGGNSYDSAGNRIDSGAPIMNSASPITTLVGGLMLLLGSVFAGRSFSPASRRVK